ncbi:MAG: transcriptional regulator [Sulfuritalea sp.]|nr:transcriptional regulator [Sulfuritalea sp.]
MRKTKSAILEAVRDTAKGLHKAGVMNQLTLREFDRLCLPPVEPLEPEQIKNIREASRVSQAVFARLLNTSLSTMEVGDRPEKTDGHRPEAASLGAEARAGSCRLIGRHGRRESGRL